MNKINVSGLSQSDLKGLVTNAKHVFNDDLGADLGLNQVRARVAHLFGAKSWQSLSAAAQAAPSTETDRDVIAFIGHRNVAGNGWDPETTFSETFHGATEEAVFADMAYRFCMDRFGEKVAEHEFEYEHMIVGELESLGIEGDRIAELAIQIRATDPDSRHDIFHLFTFKEMVQAYSKFFDDEEVIFVEPVDLDTGDQPAPLKPSHVRVIHYDTEAGMAISLEDECLIGYYALNKTPAPYEYEWDNGFDFEFISFPQAEALRRAGFGEVVDRFKAKGAVSEG
jgi:hypothetical protein